jgi:hypothetical protein
MTYIWNRVEKVPQKEMPQAVTTSFQSWAKDQYNKLKLVTDKQKKRNLLLSIKRQTENYQDAIAKYK